MLFFHPDGSMISAIDVLPAGTAIRSVMFMSNPSITSTVGRMLVPFCSVALNLKVSSCQVSFVVVLFILMNAVLSLTNPHSSACDDFSIAVRPAGTFESGTGVGESGLV